MFEKYYDSRNGNERFRIQYPHESGQHALIDSNYKSLALIGDLENVTNIAGALNAATNTSVYEGNLNLALEAVRPDDQLQVVEVLTKLIRAKIREGQIAPDIDLSYLEEVTDITSANRIFNTIFTVTHPGFRGIINEENTISISSKTSDRFNSIEDEHKWRVSMYLSQMFKTMDEEIVAS